MFPRYHTLTYLKGSFEHQLLRYKLYDLLSTSSSVRVCSKDQSIVRSFFSGIEFTSHSYLKKGVEFRSHSLTLEKSEHIQFVNMFHFRSVHIRFFGLNFPQILSLCLCIKLNFSHKRRFYFFIIHDD